MKKSISLLAGLLVFIGLAGLGQAPARADGSPAVGYVMVNVQPSGVVAGYKALSDGTDVYMTMDDIATITGQTMTQATVGDLGLSADVVLSLKLKSDEPVWFLSTPGTSALWSRIMVFGGQVVMAAGTFPVATNVTIDKTGNQTPYFNLATMLYYLHAQWQIIDGQLVVYPCGKTIFDFLDVNVLGIHNASVSQADLLMNGESHSGNAFRTTLASVYKDLDPRLFVPIWGANAVITQHYEDALLRLTSPDTPFLDGGGQQQITTLVSKDGFDEIKLDWDKLNALNDAIANVAKSGQFFTNLSNIIQGDKLVKFDRKITRISVLDELGYTKLARPLNAASTALDLVEVGYNAANVYNRSQQWGQDFTSELALLQNIDQRTIYNGDKIKSAAKKLTDEKADPLKAATSTGVWGVLGTVIEDTPGSPVGWLKGSVDAVMAALETDSTFAIAVDDAADMVNTSDLIDIEQVAWSQAYTYLNRTAVLDPPTSKDDPGNLQQTFDQLSTWRAGKVSAYQLAHDAQATAIQNLRTAVTLTLNAMIRNQISVYKYNTHLNNTSDWTATPEAQAMLQQIYQTYAWIVELSNTSDYDQLLPVGDATAYINSDQPGNMRTTNLTSAVQQGDIPSSTQTATPSAEDVQNAYDKFLSENGYESYVDSDWTYPIDQYAVLDINGDGISDLIVDSADDSGEWYTDWVFTYDPRSKSVVFAGSEYHFLPLRYSETHKAVEFSTIAHDASANNALFYTLDSSGFVLLFGIEMNGGSITIQRGGVTTQISQSEKDSYISGLTSIDFKDIPSTSGQTSTSGAGSQDLVRYALQNIDDVAKSIGGMQSDGPTDGSIEMTNGIIIIGTQPGENVVTFIEIDAACDYSLVGISFGDSYSASVTKLTSGGWQQVEKGGMLTRFQNSAGNLLSLYSETGATISGVGYFVNA